MFTAKGELAEAESGLFLAQELIADKTEFKELSTRVSSMLEAIKLKRRWNMSALITHDRSTPVTGSLLPYVETPAPAPLQTQQVAGELKDKNGGVSSQGVQLPAPLAVVASQVTEGQQQEVTKLLESVTRGAAGSQLISNYVSVLTKFTLASPDTFEIELGKLVSNLEEVRKDIKSLIFSVFMNKT